jgi:hypothetical protein
LIAYSREEKGTAKKNWKKDRDRDRERDGTNLNRIYYRTSPKEKHASVNWTVRF